MVLTIVKNDAILFSAKRYTFCFGVSNEAFPDFTSQEGFFCLFSGSMAL